MWLLSVAASVQSSQQFRWNGGKCGNVNSVPIWVPTEEFKCFKFGGTRRSKVRAASEMSHLKFNVNNGSPLSDWNSLAWAISMKKFSNMSGHTISVTMFSAKKKCTNTFVLGLRQNTSNLTLFLTCTSKHCERIFAYRNSTVISVNVFGQMGSGFATKHNLAVKHLSEVFILKKSQTIL